MPKLTTRNPTYQLHKASGKAFVKIDAAFVYLGPHGTAASKREYDRVVGEWLANGRRSPAASDLSVAELIVRYWAHVGTYYRSPDGTPTSEPSALKPSLGILNRLYGKTQAAEFGPLTLENCRRAMIEKGWSRLSINQHVSRLRRVFRWAISKQLVPADIDVALKTLSGLAAGRSDARETDPVRPVADGMIERVLADLSPTIRAMVELQTLTGSRSGELCSMRASDIDRSADVWVYRPRRHKNTYRGHGRAIPLGERARLILAPFLAVADPDGYVFSPADADATHRAARHAARKIDARACSRVA